MFISAVQQSDSVIHINILFHILFHDGLSQDSEYSSLCYNRTLFLYPLYNSLHVLNAVMMMMVTCSSEDSSDMIFNILHFTKYFYLLV